MLYYLDDSYSILFHTPKSREFISNLLMLLSTLSLIHWPVLSRRLISFCVGIGIVVKSKIIYMHTKYTYICMYSLTSLDFYFMQLGASLFPLTSFFFVELLLFHICIPSHKCFIFQSSPDGIYLFSFILILTHHTTTASYGKSTMIRW